MKKSVIFIFLCIFSMITRAHKVCLPNESIKVQRKRFISRGLLVSMARSKVLFQWPIEVCKCWVSSLFGKRGRGYHAGVDLAATKGTPVFASAKGFVDFAGYHKGYGNMVVVVHYDTGYKTRYAHLNSIDVAVDDNVNAGDVIGTVGATGLVRSASKKKSSKAASGDPSHLHFEIYKNGHRVDPLKYLFSSDRVRKKLKQVL